MKVTKNQPPFLISTTANMKSFRRSRSMYLRAASPSLDDRDDDILNDFVVSPPNRRCGMHLLESIHKLKCNTGSASKGVTLMSQSETSGDPRESHPIIRPVVVFQCHCSILLRYILRCRFTRDWNRILSGFSIHCGAEKMMLVTMH